MVFCLKTEEKNTFSAKYFTFTSQDSPKIDENSSI